MEEPLPTYTDSPRMPQHSSAALSPDGKSAGVASALVRFEYEADKTSVQDATKVLLVEWEEDQSTSILRDSPSGEWTVEWKGVGNKREGITLKSQPQQSSQIEPPSHRLYFLLQPGAPVPPSINISYTPPSAPSPAISAAIPTLPAIFPPSLLTSGTSLGKKGVLHTLWAKSRIAALRAEIDEEEEGGRAEGLGIEMARDELEWIKEHFGVGEKSYGSAGGDVPASPRPMYEEIRDEDTRGRQPQLSPPMQSPTLLPSPTSASSTSERLQQKMRGLRVGTSPSTSAPAQTATPPTSASSATTKHAPAAHQQPQIPPGILTPPQTGSSNMASKNPLSPEVGDVAVGSRSLFAALKGPHPSEAQPSPQHQTQTHSHSQTPFKATAPTTAHTTANTKRGIAVAPPVNQTASGPAFAGMGSLDGMANTGLDTSVAQSKDEEEPEEGLFALPMSPRDPDMEASPFSFTGGVRGGGHDMTI